ncbi:MAG: Ig-like domain-containing protein [Pyrinomonadaceae bacterium]
MYSHSRSIVLAFCFLSVLSLFGSLNAHSQSTLPRRITVTSEEGISLNPSISGDGRRLAFESTEDVAGAGGADSFRSILADISGASVSFAQASRTRAAAPAISQDGSRIAFAALADPLGSNPDGNSEIFVYDASGVRQITNTSPGDLSARVRNGNFQPSISDDGRFIAFSSNRDPANQNSDGNYEIFLYDSSNQTFRQPTNTNGIIGATDAKISGNGGRIAFAQDNNTALALTPGGAVQLSPQRDLMLFDRTSNATRSLAANVPNLLFTYGRAISDDGTRIVYSATTTPNSSQVFLYDERSTGVRQTTTLGARTEDVPLHPSISGDGTRLSFATRRTVTTSNSDSSVEFYTYDLPTAQFARLTSAPASATAEVVSSLSDDGQLVAFNFPRVLSGAVAASELANNSEIYVAVSGARPPFATDLQILNGASFGREPATIKAVAPDSIAVALGNNLARTSAQATPNSSGTFPTTLEGTSVRVNNRLAQLFFVSPTQVNFHVPADTELGDAQVVVTNAEGFETRGTITVLFSAPGIFTSGGDGRGEAVALDAETFLRSPFDVTDAGGNARRLIIFATGVRNASQLSVTIANRPITIESVMRTPEMPGLDEIRIVLPRELRGAGTVPIVVQSDGRASNTATITVGTGGAPPAPASITLNPTSATLFTGRTVQLRPTVRDAQGAEITDARVAFTSSNVNVATVDEAGTVRAIAPGVTTITATAGSVSTAAEVRVIQPTLVINEVLADPPDDLSGDANRDGVRSATQDEFIEIVNGSLSDIDISNYQIFTRSTTGADTLRHTFAAGTIIPAGAAVVVFGGAQSSTFNPNDPAFGGAQVFIASSGGLSLSNSGGTVTLRDASGQNLDQLTYGGSTSLDGDRNQSLTRSPDITGDFSLHGAATGSTGRFFSAGTRTDGAPFAPTPAISRIEIAPATATIIVGAQQQFTARAFDEQGRELQGVLFRWQSSVPSVATINQNGLAIGVSQGATQITASARGRTSSPATLNVLAPQRILTRIEVSPAQATVNRGATQAFTARAFDQNNIEITGVTFTWESTNTAVAAVDQNGLATGLSVGTTTIRATSGNVTGTAQLTVVEPALVINEILADPPDGSAGDANADGVRSGTDDEFVELVNSSNASLDISGYMIRTRALTGGNETTRHTFAANTILPAGDVIVVFGGGNFDPANPIFGGAQVVRASSGGLSFSNNGLTIIVRDAAGQFVREFSYGTSVDNFAGDSVNQSITRSPDVTGNFVRHTEATGAQGRRFSPGTRVDGAFFVPRAARLARVTLEPTSASLTEGSTAQFTARAFDQFNRPFANASFTFASSAPNVLSVDSVTIDSSNGVAVATVTARAVGTAQLRATATFNSTSVTSDPATVTVTAARRVTRIEVSPSAATINVGGAQQFTARAFDQNNQELTGVAFTFASSAPSVATIDNNGLARGVSAGTTAITASANGVTSSPATLTVNELPPPVVPAAGQLIINEALVAFSTSTTQTRNDFVELYNTTAGTLDISGLVISFRPSGSGNTPATVTLPGAPGSRTVLLNPNSYFLIVNGSETFGASADFNAASSNFNLNDTTGGIKIEIGDVKLDGLTYKGGSANPADVFVQYGEGAIFEFTNGATNDLIRSPNAHDTNNNAADFRRNGTTASVTPKAANPTIP